MGIAEDRIRGLHLGHQWEYAPCWERAYSVEVTRRRFYAEVFDDWFRAVNASKKETSNVAIQISSVYDVPARASPLVSPSVLGKPTAATSREDASLIRPARWCLVPKLP